MTHACCRFAQRPDPDAKILEAGADQGDRSVGVLPLLLPLLAGNAEQKRQITELREEVARLQGLKGRPNVTPPSRPSGMECGTPKKNGTP